MLGDRIRMGAHGAHPNAFIRSFSSRGELGGLSRAARAAVECFDAAGFDRIIVETVGTGQSETAIVALADTRIVVCPPGLGDDVQAIKAGTLEIADLLAVSKGDLPLAEQAARELREMLTLRRHPPGSAWKPRVLVVSAKAGTGLDELMAGLDAHHVACGHGRRRRTIEPVPSLGAVPSNVPALEHDESAPSLGAVPMHVPVSQRDDDVQARLFRLVERDGVCRTFGIALQNGAEGRAEVAMSIDARHLNFNGGCHGGAIFALADTAFGLASNSHGPVAVGIDAHITFQAPVRRGDRLVARATESSAAGASASTASTLSAATRAAPRRWSPRSPAPSSSRLPVRRRLEGYTGGYCPVDCRQNDNAASKSSYSDGGRPPPGAAPAASPGTAVNTTFPRLLLDHAARRPNAPALREKDLGIWQTLPGGAR